MITTVDTITDILCPEMSVWAYVQTSLAWVAVLVGFFFVAARRTQTGPAYTRRGLAIHFMAVLVVTLGPVEWLMVDSHESRRAEASKVANAIVRGDFELS